MEGKSHTSTLLIPQLFYLHIDYETKEVFLDNPDWGEEQKEIGDAEREVHFPAKMLESK